MASRGPAYPAKGIVIGRTNFGEADRIVRMLTPDRGKISAVAKGIRKIKSRAGGHLEPLGEVEVMLVPGGRLDVVTSARLHWYPHQLTSDYPRLVLALAIVTTVDRLTEPDQPVPALYAALRQALVALNEAAEPDVLELWFKLQLLGALGYRPELAACVVCGRHTPEESYAFSPERGGIVCSSDATPLDTPMSPSGIKFWRLLIDYPFTTIAHVQGAPELSRTTLPLCNAFAELHLGRSFQAWDTQNPPAKSVY